MSFGADVVYYSDYYPYGSPLTLANNDYRYGYQGQYAEADKETNWNAFELRNYDAAIGRWLSVDPYGQYASPYLGMGNNPVSGVDPDGGYSKFGAVWRNIWYGGEGAYKVGNEWGFNHSVKGGGAGVNFWDGKSADNYIPRIQTYNPNFIDNWSASNNTFSKFTYSFVDGFYVTGQNLITKNIIGDGNAYHLNGESSTPKENVGAFVDAASIFIPETKVKGLELFSILNAPKFSRIFKGNLAKLAPSTRGAINKGVNKVIKSVNGFVSGGEIVRTGVDVVSQNKN